MADYIYPLLNFHFDVEFHNKNFKGDSKFQSVNGLHARLLKEEGQKNPRSTFDNLTLRRAYEPDSKLVAWCMNAINNKVFQEETLVIRLMNSKHETVSAWIVENAIPVSWSVSELHAEESMVLLETIELKYSYFQIIDSRGKTVAPILK